MAHYRLVPAVPTNRMVAELGFAGNVAKAVVRKGAASKVVGTYKAMLASTPCLWIKSDDQLPEYRDEVLAFCSVIGRVYVADYNHGNHTWRLSHDGSSIEGITHWLPLPEFPLHQESEQ